jgi:hypothetical protein
VLVVQPSTSISARIARGFSLALIVAFLAAAGTWLATHDSVSRLFAQANVNVPKVQP